eukprot:SAG31_NODE_6258_length_2099_cov_4.347500_4_plen_150_part_00
MLDLIARVQPEDDAKFPPEIAAQIEEEDTHFDDFAALHSPPADDKSRSKLFRLLVAPLVRMLGFVPHRLVVGKVQTEVQMLREQVGCTAKPKTCAELCARAVKGYHAILEYVETLMDDTIQKVRLRYCLQSCSGQLLSDALSQILRLLL